MKIKASIRLSSSEDVVIFCFHQYLTQPKSVISNIHACMISMALLGKSLVQHRFKRDEIRDWIWLSYRSQIQQELRRDCVITTPAGPSNLGDEDVPF